MLTSTACCPCSCAPRFNLLHDAGGHCFNAIPLILYSTADAIVMASRGCAIEAPIFIEDFAEIFQELMHDVDPVCCRLNRIKVTKNMCWH